MAASANALRIGDVASKIGSGATPRGGKEAYRASGPFALIRSQNVRNEGFARAGLAYIDAFQAEALRNVEVLEGDVLLNITGDSVARACQVDPGILPARVNQHVAIIRPDPLRLDPRYLRYWLVSRPTQAQLLGLASAGATRDALTKRMIEDLSIEAPALDEQRRIAHTLGTLDDKVELNRRMSATLAEMARALFKSWFVDFDPVRAKAEGRDMGLPPHIADLFPDRLVNSVRAPVPDGWTTRRLDAICNVAIGRTPPRGEREWFLTGDQDGVPWASIRDMGDATPFLASTRECLTRTAVERKRVKVARAGSLLLSFKLTIGRIAIPVGDMATNEAIAQLEPLANRELWVPYLWMCLSTFDFEQLGSTSSIAYAVNSKSIRGLELLVPDQATLAAFATIVGPFLGRIRSLTLDTSVLTATRDDLLAALIR